MKKYWVSVALFTLIVMAVQAQKRNNQVQLFAETGMAKNDQKTGFGGGLKAAYGVGDAGQLTLSAALLKFNSKKMTDVPATTTRVISVLAGYKHFMSKLYIEPQAGLGELGGKIAMTGDYARPSVATFCWAMGVGMEHRRFDIGVRYLSAAGIEGKDAGTWYNRRFYYTGLHIGYKIVGR